MQISASPREIFPLFRQLLYDAFQTDALLFTWPYENFEQIDNSIRKTLWGSSRYAPLELLDHADITSAHHIVIFKSSLRFYNMICLLSSDSHSDFISIGPFRDQEVTSSFLSQTARDNHLTGESLSVMKKYYSTMPLADPESVASFASHFLSAFLRIMTKYRLSILIFLRQTIKLFRIRNFCFPRPPAMRNNTPEDIGKPLTLSFSVISKPLPVPCAPGFRSPGFSKKCTPDGCAGIWRY